MSNRSTRRRELNLAVVFHSSLVIAFLLSVATVAISIATGAAVILTVATVVGIVVLVSLVALGYVLARRSEGPQATAVRAAYLPVLRDELAQLEATLDREHVAGSAGYQEIRECRDLVLAHVEAAARSIREGGDSIRIDQVTEAVAHIADARYLLVVHRHLTRGEQPPRRGGPCFFDPAHGPITTKTRFNPTDGPDRTITVCDSCRRTLAAGTAPASKTILVDGAVTDYWRAGWVSVPYVDGYWQERKFPDHETNQLRRKLKLTWDVSETRVQLQSHDHQFLNSQFDL